MDLHDPEWQSELFIIALDPGPLIIAQFVVAGLYLNQVNVLMLSGSAKAVPLAVFLSVKTGGPLNYSE